MQQDTGNLWQQALKHAIEEADPRQALAKIDTAEVAIFRRIRAFAPSPNALEDEALLNALGTIRSLKAVAQRRSRTLSA